jgi:cephalosporin hydroxylase
MLNALEQVVTDHFHAMYYCSTHTWNSGHTAWRGVGLLQNPLDMWMLQEIIMRSKPDLIVETGSALGGSALFYTDVLPTVRVISIDTQDRHKPVVKNPRITFIKGMSTDKKIVQKVRWAAKGKKVMVILDSDHSTPNVIAEMRAYHGLVAPGCYMVVEDTNVGGNPVHHYEVTDGGPMKAVEMFLAENQDFLIDKNCEKYYMTFHPNGWLRRK